MKELITDYFCLNKKYLVYNLVSKNIKIKYRRSYLGVLWTLLVPLATAAVYYFVFKVILKINTPHYIVFIMSGILPWVFFSQCFNEGILSQLSHAGMLSKVYIPTSVFPLSIALTALFNLVVSTPVLIGLALFSGTPITVHYLHILYLAPLFFLIGHAFAVILGLGMVFFRDLGHIAMVVMQIWFYATPILYSEKMIPEKFQYIIHLNPLGSFFESFHRMFIDGIAPRVSSVCYAFAWSLGFTLLAIYVNRKHGRMAVEYL